MQNKPAHTIVTGSLHACVHAHTHTSRPDKHSFMSAVENMSNISATLNTVMYDPHASLSKRVVGVGRVGVQGSQREVGRCWRKDGGEMAYKWLS